MVTYGQLFLLVISGGHPGIIVTTLYRFSARWGDGTRYNSVTTDYPGHRLRLKSHYFYRDGGYEPLRMSRQVSYIIHQNWALRGMHCCQHADKQCITKISNWENRWLSSGAFPTCRDVSWLELRVCLCNIWRPSHRGQGEDIGSEGRGGPQSDNLSPSPPDCPFPHFLHLPRRPCRPFVGKQINLLKRNCFSVIDQLYCHIQDSRFTYKWSIPPAPAKDVRNHSLLSSANRYEYTGSSSDHCHVRCK